MVNIFILIMYLIGNRREIGEMVVLWLGVKILLCVRENKYLEVFGRV